MKSSATYQLRTLKALARARFKSVQREFEREAIPYDLVEPADDAPPPYRDILEALPTNGRVN